MLGQKIKIKNHKTRLADITLNTSNLKLIISISWQTASNSHTPISLCPYQYDTSLRKQKSQEKMKARRIIFHLPTTELPCKGVYFCVSSYLMEDISLTKANFSTCDFHLLSCIFYILFFAGWTPHFLYLYQPTSLFQPQLILQKLSTYSVWICLFLIPFLKRFFIHHYAVFLKLIWMSSLIEK